MQALYAIFTIMDENKNLIWIDLEMTGLTLKGM